MSISTGTRLGPYEIVAAIGAGGMGEVYRARDTRLGRDVALKILPQSITLDAERLRRFALEARAAAALNHPNIVVVHDIGTDGEVPYVVSELLDGETLRDRLRRGLLPPRKAVDYATQIARGLAAAHDKGIVHRDLKPENIFITRDGHAKILDFGLAKFVAPEHTETLAPTREPATTPGVVLGTVGYMSPEQVRGLAADHRSDIFSFGAVLYEMLSGQRAFTGATQADTIAAILNADPPELADTNRAIAPILDQLIRRCLEKSADERFQSVRDVAFNLEALSTLSSATAEADVHRARSPKVVWLGVAAAAGLLIGAAGATFLAYRTRSGEPPRFHQLTFRRGTIFQARFAPDRETVVYSASWEAEPIGLFAARVGAVGERPLGINARILAISASGEMALLLNARRIDSGPSAGALPDYWWSAGTLARAPLAGGAPHELLRDVGGADWSSDGRQLAITRWMPESQRWRIEYPVGTVLYETAHWLDAPRLSRRGDRVAFIEHPSDNGDDRGTIAVVSTARVKQTLTKEFESTRGVAWSNDQEIWFTASESGVRRNLFGVTLSGALRSILQAPAALQLDDIDQSGRVLVHSDANKSRLFVKAPDAVAEREMGWLDYPFAGDISADGKLLLFQESGEGGGPTYSVYVRNTSGAPAIRLGEGGFPLQLSPDVQWALTSPVTVGARYTLLPIGVGEPRPLDIPADKSIGARWFPDGKRLLVNGTWEGGRVRAYEYVLDSKKLRPLTPGGTRGLLVSADNHTLLMQDANGQWLLRALDGGGQAKPVVGHEPDDFAIRWAVGEQEVFVSAATSGLRRTVVRLNVMTGRREPWNSVGPSDPAGVVEIGLPVITADGHAYAYNYVQALSDLFVAEGIR
jgi:hypothetical protein